MKTLPLSSSARLPVFKCERIHTRLPRSSCGKRHKAGEDPTCKRCPIGVAHAKGEEPTTWPDGSPIVVLGLRRFDRIPGRRKRPAA
jgi:hypothetical protein